MPLDKTTVGQYHDASNSRIRKIGRITGPSSYATGGEAVTMQQIGMGRVEIFNAEPMRNGSTAVRIVAYDYTNQKIMWFTEAFVEVAAAVDLSSFSGRFEAVGV
jgi:hypothetical protein